ncbi:hypothetical protein [Okeania sp. KiyG1]|uniref:hypothetical protein n=1 Tax=Okeania sp. KiyG1 TaxID=2720165 RepID=UPI0019206EB7|nr:hypothetical protein [Okeania sp. KiyG1]
MVFALIETFHATSLQDFGYGDVVHQLEKRCKPLSVGAPFGALRNANGIRPPYQ